MDAEVGVPISGPNVTNPVPDCPFFLQFIRLYNSYYSFTLHCRRQYRFRTLHNIRSHWSKRITSFNFDEFVKLGRFTHYIYVSYFSMVCHSYL